jgi:hypothetical protein
LACWTATSRGCVRDEIKAGGGEARVDELLEVMDRVLRR